MWQKIKNIYHLFVSFFANLTFLFPARKLIMIGVTGTDGKTTTVHLVYHILKSAHKNVSMLTSIGAQIADRAYETGYHVTTPSSFSLQRILRRAVSEKCEYFVLEVTSHALDQYRTWGIPFKIGVLTNITSEHLDYHKTYDAYVKTKEKLLKLSEIAVVNHDDSSYTLLSSAMNSKSEEYWKTYGSSESADLNLKNFPIEGKNLPGEFNKLNALAAASCCLSLGIDREVIKDAIASFKMPLGRFDFVYEEDFSVVIDFAHTPNAFEKLLSALRPQVSGRLIHVFGAAGERDHAKRPFMGEISAKFSDILILTGEDPRSEDVNKIISEIEGGIKKKDAEVIKITDRKEAIKTAIEMALIADLVVITGKSHEKSMTYGRREIPWDEYKTVQDALLVKSKHE